MVASGAQWQLVHGGSWQVSGPRPQPMCKLDLNKRLVCLPRNLSGLWGVSGGVGCCWGEGVGQESFSESGPPAYAPRAPWGPGKVPDMTMDWPQSNTAPTGLAPASAQQGGWRAGGLPRGAGPSLGTCARGGTAAARWEALGAEGAGRAPPRQ